MVALDHGHRAAGLQQAPERDERLDRLRQVLEQEADEDVVERLGLQRQIEDVGLEELDVRVAGRCDARLGLR